MATIQDYRDALDALIPYALSRAEELENFKEHGDEDLEHDDGADAAWEAIEAARALMAVPHDAPDAADAPEEVDVSPVEVVETPDPVDANSDPADAPAYDGDAYLVAMEIVGAYDDDAFGRWLAPSTWSDRRINIEDALIAWPGEVEPAMGIPMTDQEPQESPQEPDAPVCATRVAETAAAPVSKPRYRYSPVSGSWELVEPAGEIECLAA